MNDFERRALDALLVGDHPALVTLRVQCDAARVRDRQASEVGQFTDFWVEDDVPVLEQGERFAVDDVFAAVSGIPDEVALLLHVVRGRLKTLEAFVAPSAWPVDPVLERTWYVAPDREQAGQLRPVPHRDLGFALRGLALAGQD